MVNPGSTPFQSIRDTRSELEIAADLINVLDRESLSPPSKITHLNHFDEELQTNEYSDEKETVTESPSYLVEILLCNRQDSSRVDKLSAIGTAFIFPILLFSFLPNLSPYHYDPRRCLPLP